MDTNNTPTLPPVPDQPQQPGTMPPVAPVVAQPGALEAGRQPSTEGSTMDVVPGNAPQPGTEPAAMPGQPMPQPLAPAPLGAMSTPAQPAAGWQQPAGQMPMTGMNSAQPGKKKPPMLLLIIGAIVILLLVAGGAYFLFFRHNDRGAVNNAAKSSSDQAMNATDMATLSALTLNPPANMTGFKANDLGVPTVKDYTDPTGNCDLQFGTLTAAQLPGTDIGAILAPQIKTIRNAGATVTGPTAGTALMLNATSGSAMYSMPTLNLSFSEGVKRAVSHYSAVILKGDRRAFVSRSCVNATGAIDQSAFNVVEAKAKLLTVTMQ